MLEFKTLFSGSKGNAYCLEGNSSKILIEVGIFWRQIQKKMNFKVCSKIDFALVSHRHADHSKAIKDIMKAGIDVLTSQDVIDYHKLTGHRIHVLTPLKQIQVEAWKILPFSVVHDVPNLGFIIKTGKNKIMFLTDCMYSPYIVPGLTHIAIGINYCEDILKQNIANGITHPALGKRIMQSHMSLDTALEFLRITDLSKVEEIHILHTSEINADKDKIKEAVQKKTGKLITICQPLHQKQV